LRIPTRRRAVPNLRNVDPAGRGWRPKYALLPPLPEVEL
jgi:hypothetical protein